MTAFRVFLGTFLVVLVAYTLVVISNHGFGLFQVFFGDMMAMTWPGQFNLDFFGFLLLSGIWVVWRNSFRPAGFGLGVLAVLGGMSFLPVYLLYLSFRTNGDIPRMVLGDERVAS